MKHTTKRKQGGFTLMEMVLVLGIIALLAGTGIAFLVGVGDFGKETKVKADLNTLASALRAYEAQSLTLPTSRQGLQALVERPGSKPQPKSWRQFLKKPLLDPWGNEYQYSFPGNHDPKGFDLSSNGPDGKPGTPDDIGNWDL
ncbi:MAG: type II secretion system major pseudopilin GspG [Verrucomicrobiales bacterium]|nr:type II secretion system major pseudopilin GspG [Verrucomicrobiales bacterium]